MPTSCSKPAIMAVSGCKRVILRAMTKDSAATRMLRFHRPFKSVGDSLEDLVCTSCFMPTASATLRTKPKPRRITAARKSEVEAAPLL